MEATSSGNGTTPSPPTAGFGGVIEVRFTTQDAAVQDATAAACGLPVGQQAGLASAPLPPNLRWYPQPAAESLEGITDCLEGQPMVLRVTLPL